MGRADQAIERAGAKAARRAPQAASGAGYLAGKKRAQDMVRERVARGQARAEAVFASLSARAVEAHRRLPPAGSDLESNLLLDAAFLVTAGRTAQFQARARLLARDLGNQEGYSVELTGPWPPYNFIEPDVSPLRRRGPHGSRRVSRGRNPRACGCLAARGHRPRAESRGRALRAT